MGGYSTIFMGLTTGYTVAQFGGFKTVPLVTPITSKCGLLSLARNAGVLFGPTLLGLYIGVHAFGDAKELRNLIRNGSIYRREFKSLHDELYCN